MCSRLGLKLNSKSKKIYCVVTQRINEYVVECLFDRVKSDSMPHGCIHFLSHTISYILFDCIESSSMSQGAHGFMRLHTTHFRILVMKNEKFIHLCGEKISENFSIYRQYIVFP